MKYPQPKVGGRESPLFRLPSIALSLFNMRAHQYERLYLPLKHNKGRSRVARAIDSQRLGYWFDSQQVHVFLVFSTREIPVYQIPRLPKFPVYQIPRLRKFPFTTRPFTKSPRLANCLNSEQVPYPSITYLGN